MATNNTSNSAYAPQPKEKKLLLAKLFTDAPVRTEPKEPQKILVAGLAEAQPVKDYPDTFFGRAASVFRGEFSTLLKSSVFFILFTLPFVIILAWFAGYFENMVLGGTYNFMGNVGIGFPGGGDDISRSVADLIWNVKVPVIGMLAATLVFGSLGLSGLFYCAKRSYFQNFYKQTIRTFWMGFAKYWWKFLVTATVMVCIGYAMIVSLMFLLYQQALGIAGAGAYCAVVFSWVLGAPMLLVPMIMMSLFTSYELTFVQCFKNALVIIANSPVVVVIVAVLSAAPLALCAVGGKIFPILIYIVMAVVGATFMSLSWIAMGDRGMVKCHNRKTVTDKQAQQEMLKAKKIAKKQSASQNTQPAKKKKAQPAPYQNPKKKKKK